MAKRSKLIVAARPERVARTATQCNTKSNVYMLAKAQEINTFLGLFVIGQLMEQAILEQPGAADAIARRL
jgi:hypothetical protein